MTFFNNNFKAYLFLSFCALLYFFPFFITGKNTIFPIVDNLDCYYVWNKIAAQPQYAWANPSAIIAEYMNGLPRFTLINSYSLFFFLNIFFSAFYAATIHIILIHTIACFAMYAFAVKYLTRGNIIAAIVAAIVFGFREYIYAYGLSLALLPLLAMVFINFINNKQSTKDWLFLLIYPFLSNFQSVGIFILGLWFVLSVYFIIAKKLPVAKFFLALMSMGLLYYANNYPTLNNLLFDSYFISHRKAFAVNSIAQRMGNILTTEEPHNLDFYLTFIFDRKIFVLCGFILYKMYKSKHESFKLFLFITVAMIFFQCQFIILDSAALKYLQEKVLLFRMYHFNKLFVFELFFQAMAYAIIVAYLLSVFKTKWAGIAVILLMLPFVVRLSLFWKPIIGLQWQTKARPYQGYYSPDLFEQIKQRIALPVNKYKVASFGIQPAVASYNGLYTVDGYINNYPLTYRNQFREVIQEDLALINKQFKFSEFDTRGHFCYLQTVDLIKNGNMQIPIDKLNPISVPQEVHWNFAALRSLGCNYIISSIEIKTNQVELIDRLENHFYKLYLYKI
ncbi:DUF6044 family protein [Ferruginibacter lapsinanis]|uniref:DUF6044 family protein n=1 Tax=Ferruginibacter lapsinanis TaxID=563172 RepID=UPI001E35A5B1|nr:DUF6044 family protein [Ferruginibacter lapsinanis]UEG50581.1 DUF6044 family protein [Ferruginibacter lapsinanis]